jgi:hypothetical protein
MNVKNCGTCVHASKPDDAGWSNCLRISEDADYKMKPSDVWIAGTGGEYGYESWLYVKPEFGCVLWEPKQTEKELGIE